jgi:hypothetical protein
MEPSGDELREGLERRGRMEETNELSLMTIFPLMISTCGPEALSEDQHNQRQIRREVVLHLLCCILPVRST